MNTLTTGKAHIWRYHVASATDYAMRYGYPFSSVKTRQAWFYSVIYSKLGI